MRHMAEHPGQNSYFIPHPVVVLLQNPRHRTDDLLLLLFGAAASGRRGMDVGLRVGACALETVQRHRHISPDLLKAAPSDVGEND